MKLILAGFFLCCSVISARQKQEKEKNSRRPEGVGYRLVSLEQHHPSSLVTSGQIVTGVVKFDGRDDIRCRAIVSRCTLWRLTRFGRVVRGRLPITFCNIFYIAFIAEASKIKLVPIQ